MGIRITTWNVNGIRNPFGYQPWRDKRTFEGMFDILEADIVIFQETKIQRKDLRDDMVLVPGWDCYWSLPKHKKGYSGVVIYTRNSKCAPIKAEEGITGFLSPPNTASSFRDLPEDQQIGGYPTIEQLSESDFDPPTLDAEGRCVILEFPAFVLIGTYCPAERDETRTHFRTGFLSVLDSRIRNLVKNGKRVIWTGDLNISREQLDTAAAEESMRKHNMDAIEWISTPARRLFNQLLVGGIVHGERDEGREDPILWDICRSFHEGRKGMYTCWETKVNARPGNFGARIDYVVCSRDMKDWFQESDIQEGLMGSDHCPVYAITKDKIMIGSQEHHILDLMNPAGTFEDGIRREEWSRRFLLPTSGKLIPEFDRRNNIRDMFTRTLSMPLRKNGAVEVWEELTDTAPTSSTSTTFTESTVPSVDASVAFSVPQPSQTKATKRGMKSEVSTPPSKKLKSGSKNGDTNSTPKGQQSLKGFFQAKSTPVEAVAPTVPSPPPIPPESTDGDETLALSLAESIPPSPLKTDPTPQDEATNEAATFVIKQTWGKLFARPVAPKCEHDEPCKTMLTKKPGVNCGRSFWMCNRPLGPSGNKEKGTQWRCGTFIWCSDWDTHVKDPG